MDAIYAKSAEIGLTSRSLDVYLSEII